MEMLLDTLKWSAVVGALTLVTALFRPLLEKRYRARWRYWLWLVLAVLALLAPVRWEKLLPSASAVTAPVVIDVPQMSLYVSRETGITFQTSAPDLPAAVPESAEARAVELGKILPVIWLGGAAVFGLYHLLGIWAFRRKVLRWSRPASEEALDVYDAVWQDMELEKAPPLRISSAVGSPMLLGMLRPCLLLPGENWNNWELAFILRHELTHYKRHDLWYKLVLLAANALHWFNPLLYLLRKEAGADLELTCDDAVVAGMNREARRAYSETLLSAIHQEKGVASALSTHFYGGKEVMKERFRNILTKRRRKRGVFVLALAVLAAIFFACAFGLRQAEPELPDQRAEGEPEQADNAPRMSSLGGTETFIYEGLELTVTHVRETRQGSQITDIEEEFPYTIFVCYPGAVANISAADMDGGYPEWAFDLASGGHIDITDGSGPVDITEDTLGIYNKEASLYVLRFEMYSEQPSLGEEPEIKEPSSAGLAAALEQYRPVMLDEQPFVHVDNGARQSLMVSNIAPAVSDDASIQVSIPQFSVADLDYDGIPEVVLWLRLNGVNDVGFEVLHSTGGEVYGYMLFYRTFMELKTDGTFSWSSGAGNNGFGTISFSEDGYTIHEAGSTGDTDVTWYEFTPDNIDTILGDK